MQNVEESRVVYTITMEDLVAFNLFLYRNSPTLRAMQRRYSIRVTLATALTALGMLLCTRIMPLWPALFTASAATAWTAGYLLYYQKRGYVPRVRKMVHRVYSEGKSPSVMGEHALEVDEEGFTEITDFSRSNYAWGGLIRIETEPGYTYLFTGAQSAFVIPHEAITSGDFKTVLEQISRHYQPDKALAR